MPHDQKKDESLGSFRKALGPVAPYIGLGMQLAGTVLFFMGIGYLVDIWLDTLPFFLVVGAVVGIIMMFVQLIRAARDMSRRSEADKRKRARERHEAEQADTQEP